MTDYSIPSTETIGDEMYARLYAGGYPDGFIAIYYNEDMTQFRVLRREFNNGKLSYEDWASIDGLLDLKKDVIGSEIDLHIEFIGDICNDIGRLAWSPMEISRKIKELKNCKKRINKELSEAESLLIAIWSCEQSAKENNGGETYEGGS